jgi:hypothetical protein
MANSDYGSAVSAFLSAWQQAIQKGIPAEVLLASLPHPALARQQLAGAGTGAQAVGTISKFLRLFYGR